MNPNGKNQVGLNAPAPKANVNAVGVLGALGQTKGKGGKVSADMVINEGVISQTVSGPSGKIVVKQPPAGVIGTGTGGSGGKITTNLGAASTTLNVKDVVGDSSGSAILGGNRTGGDGVTIGYGTGEGDAYGAGVGSKRGVGNGMGKDAYGEQVVGGLDKESVRRALASHKGEIRTCYERALRANSKVGGRVSYRWTISPKGPVVNIRLLRSQVNSPTLEGCVQNVIKDIVFPVAPNGQQTIVIYPFEFMSKN